MGRLQRQVAFFHPLRPTVSQLRRLIGVFAILRWAGLAALVMIGVAAPSRSALVLIVLIVGTAVYNIWALLVVGRVSDASVPRVAWALLALDATGAFLIFALFMTPGTQSAGYMLVVIEAVGYFGFEGAVVSVAAFFVGIWLLQWVRVALYDLPVSGEQVLLWPLGMILAGLALASIQRILLTAPGVVQSAGANGGAGARLSENRGNLFASDGRRAAVLTPREREVLQLIAGGCSNQTIAAQLGVSEKTVKTYMKSLLASLNAGNRAEAVAAASRLGILE